MSKSRIGCGYTQQSLSPVRKELCSWDKLHNDRHLMVLTLDLKRDNFQISPKTAETVNYNSWFFVNYRSFLKSPYLGSSVSTIKYRSLCNLSRLHSSFPTGDTCQKAELGVATLNSRYLQLGRSYAAGISCITTGT